MAVLGRMACSFRTACLCHFIATVMKTLAWEKLGHHYPLPLKIMLKILKSYMTSGQLGSKSRRHIPKAGLPILMICPFNVRAHKLLRWIKYAITAHASATLIYAQNAILAFLEIRTSGKSWIPILARQQLLSIVSAFWSFLDGVWPKSSTLVLCSKDLANKIKLLIYTTIVY